MKYLLSLYGDESEDTHRTPEQMQEAMRGWDAFTKETQDAGAFLGGEGLQPTSTATTVAIQEGGAEPIVTDGPFAETKEQLGGFYLLECKDLDEALEWARKIPMPSGKVEVRPVMDYEEAGGSEVHSQSTAAQR
jgi:hypothetical protein